MIVSPWPSRDRDGRLSPSYAEMEDADLLERLRAKDARALDALYDRYARLAYSLALKVLPDRGRAEEIVQDAYVKLWREPWLFDPSRGAFRTWFLRLIHNRGIDELRHTRREREQRLDDPEGDVWQSLPDPGLPTDEQVMSTLSRDAVLDALDRLAPQQRAAICLAYFDGLTQTEIAAQLGEPLGTIKTRIRLGMRRLRELLGGPERG